MTTLKKTNGVYYAFGLNIRSEIPFPDMPPMKAAADVVIQYGTAPKEIHDATIIGVRYQACPSEFLLQVDGIARYYVTEGRSITIERTKDAAEEEVLLFLMGSAMGALLHQRNLLPLHAGAIGVNGESVLFLGPSSIGKSTLAAGFQKKGYTLLADDVCAINGNGSGPSKVIPGFPRLKLWGDALKKLETETKGLNCVRVNHSLNKYFVPFDNIAPGPMPVRSIFVLKKNNTDQFNIEELKGMARVDPIIKNTFRPRFVQGTSGKLEHFRLCSHLADKARVFELARPKKGYQLDELMAIAERYW